MSQGILPWFPWAPYDWSDWFAWYPVRMPDGWPSVGWVQVRAHAVIAPEGDLTDRYEYRRPVRREGEVK